MWDKPSHADAEKSLHVQNLNSGKTVIKLNVLDQKTG